MASTPIPKRILARQHEITADFKAAIDQHLAEVVAGKVTEMWEIRDAAAQLCIHPTHLSNTIKLTTGHSPCDYFEARILAVAKEQLLDPGRSIADVAAGLTFDASNFTKFFKRFAGLTPKEYREQEWERQRAAKSEPVTIFPEPATI